MHDFMNFSSNILQRLRREQEDIVSVTLPIVVTVYYRIGSQAKSGTSWSHASL